jgi:hypothetical protein
MGRWRDAALAAGRREREREREESTGEGGRLGLGWLACAARGWRPGAANRAGEEAGRWQVRVIIAGKRGLELDGVGGVGCWCCRPTGHGPAVRRGGVGQPRGGASTGTGGTSPPPPPLVLVPRPRGVRPPLPPRPAI